MDKYDLSLILACYNEEQIFEESVKKILKTLDQTDLSWEVIFVEDGSSDNTAELVKKTLRKYPRRTLRAVFHKKNQGRGKAVSDGFLKANGRIVGFLDIDLEIPEDYIPVFVKKIEDGVDGVVARRIYSFGLKGLLRFILSKGYILFRQVLLNIDLPEDTEAGYKFFKRKKILPVLKKCQNKGWFWDTEIMVRSKMAGLKIVDIPTVFIRRSDKTSTVKVIPDTWDYLVQLIKFRRKIQELRTPSFSTG